MKPEIAFSIVTATATVWPVAMPRHKSETVDSSGGEIVTLHLGQFAAHGFEELILTANAQPAGRSLGAIAKLKQLVDGWDGDDAPAPSRLAIENALLIVEALESRAVPNVKISADVGGGVMVTVAHRLAGQYAAVACDNEGDTHLILEAPPRLPRVSRIAPEDAAPAMFDFVLG